MTISGADRLSQLLLDQSVRMTALLLVAWLVTLILRRQSAATRSLVWFLGVCGCLILPLLTLVTPARDIQTTAAPAVVMGLLEPAPLPIRPALEPRADAPPPPATAMLPDADRQPWTIRTDRATALVTVWLVGAVVTALGYGLAARRWWHLIRSGGEPDARWRDVIGGALAAVRIAPSRVRFVQTEAAMPPSTWGLLQPTVIVPAAGATWPTERRRDAVLHELAHVQRRDVLLQAVANLATILFWFHPLAWWAARGLLVERERACDDLVLATGTRPSDYAASLLEIARSFGAGPLLAQGGLAMARRSEISGRLLAVIDPDRNRRRVPTPAILLAAALTLLVATPLSSFALRGHLDPADTTPAATTQAPSRTWTLAEIRQAIDQANRAEEQAVAHRNLDSIRAHYSADTQVMAPGDSHGHGPRQVQTMVQNTLDAGFNSLVITTLEVTRLDPVTAMETGHYTYRHHGGRHELNGRYITIWRLEDGRWMIYRSMSNV